MVARSTFLLFQSGNFSGDIEEALYDCGEEEIRLNEMLGTSKNENVPLTENVKIEVNLAEEAKTHGETPLKSLKDALDG